MVARPVKKNAELRTTFLIFPTRTLNKYHRSCSVMENLKTIRTLRMKDLPSKVGFQPSTIYGLIAQGKFPKPFKLAPGGRAAGWDEALIDAWITARVEECK